jgi:hypothetical protein
MMNPVHRISHLARLRERSARVNAPGEGVTSDFTHLALTRALGRATSPAGRARYNAKSAR